MSTDAAAMHRRATVNLTVGIGLVVAAAGLGLWAQLRGDPPFVVDEWWNAFVSDLFTPALTWFALVLDRVGGGWIATFVVPIGGAIALVLVRRPWAGGYFLAASAISVVLVQALKHLFGRIRPEDMLVISDLGSYPSGHVANAATIAVCAAIIFPRRWVVVVGAGWVVLMAFSRTYLHAHWLTDTVGGTMVGVGAALMVAAAFATRMEQEVSRRAEMSRR